HFTSMTDSFVYLRECRRLEKLEGSQGQLSEAELMKLRMTSSQLRLSGTAKRLLRKVGKLAAKRAAVAQ
ncbi:MAG: hypothetical protein WBQ79_16190, partial [Acidobacteriaceae bacterium]